MHENLATNRLENDCLYHFVAVTTSLLGSQNFTHLVDAIYLDVLLREGSKCARCNKLRRVKSNIVFTVCEVELNTADRLVVLLPHESDVLELESTQLPAIGLVSWVFEEAILRHLCWTELINPLRKRVLLEWEVILKEAVQAVLVLQRILVTITCHFLQEYLDLICVAEEGENESVRQEAGE